MKRFWGHLIAVVGLAVSVAGLNAACAHDDSTIFVRQVIAPPASQGAGAACTYSSDPSQAFINSGVLDAALASSYQAVFLIGNQMAPQADQTTGRTETSRVNLQGAIVRLTDVQGKELRPAFTRSAAGLVDPATGGTPGYAAYAVEILDPTTTASIQAPERVMAYVKVFGHTLGGLRVETNEFQFPIDVCKSTVDNPCLVYFPPGVNSTLPGAPPNNCAGGSMGGSSASTSPCFFGQDQRVDCRNCVGALAVCGSGTTGVADAGGGG